MLVLRSAGKWGRRSLVRNRTSSAFNPAPEALLRSQAGCFCRDHSISAADGRSKMRHEWRTGGSSCTNGDDSLTQGGSGGGYAGFFDEKKSGAMTLKRRALADRRKAVGLTQEQLAARLGVERSTVVRWEAGETEPQPWCRPRLAQALAVSPDVLHDLLANVDGVRANPRDAILLSLLGDVTCSEIGTLMERFAAMDVASRREVLQQLTIISGTILLQPVRRWLAQALTIVPLVSPESVGNDALDALERSAILFRRWDASGVGSLRRKAVVGQLNAVAESLSESHSPAVTRRLFHITAELAQLAGWMAYDQGLRGVAQRYYLLALSACQEAKSPMLGAKILGNWSGH